MAEVALVDVDLLLLGDLLQDEVLLEGQLGAPQGVLVQNALAAADLLLGHPRGHVRRVADERVIARELDISYKLIGDVNASGLVDGNDVSAVQSHTRQSMNNTNFRYDVNTSGQRRNINDRFLL